MPFRLYPYSLLKLKQDLFSPMNSLVSPFDFQLKKRIIMMTQPKSARRKLAKYLLIVPLLAVLCAFFVRKEQPTAPFDATSVAKTLQTALDTDAKMQKFYKQVIPMFEPQRVYLETYRKLMLQYPTHEEEIRKISKALSPGGC